MPALGYSKELGGKIQGFSVEKKGRGRSERLEIANKVNDNPGAGDTAGGWVSMVAGNAGPDPQGGMRGAGRGTISRRTPLSPPCAHQVPFRPSHTPKFLSLRRFCHQPVLVEQILGQHRSSGAAPSLFFLETRAWKRCLRGAGGCGRSSSVIL